MRINHYMAYLRVAVDSVEDGRMTGRVYSQRLKEPIIFRDMVDLILQIEDLLDRQDFPRAFQRKRTFGEKDRRNGDKKQAPHRKNDEDMDEAVNMDEEMVLREKGAVSSFDIHVITRQNTTWQGYLDWLDGKEKTPYDSVLELLAMITERIKN